jgi:hypothetical protein
VIAAGSPAECIEAYVSATYSAHDGDALPIRLLSLSPPEPASVNPGGRVCLRIRGTVAAPGSATTMSVGVRVRSLPREELVFLAASDAAEIELPQSGNFDLEIDVQMNVPPGMYRAQAVVWDLPKFKEVTRGESVFIVVGGTRVNQGRVYADPRFRLMPQ